MERRTDLINRGGEYLEKAGLVNPLGESKIFLAHVLACTLSELYLDNLTVEEKQRRRFWELLALRKQAFPLQYLVGSTEFMQWEFKMAPGVFIPRPETEILVETVLQFSVFSRQSSANILDIGTGCGNIAISLAKFLKRANIFACDISESALQLAKENARLHKARVYLIKSNLFCAFKRKGAFSLLISNPPYISAPEIPALPRELSYEPKEAYAGGEDGLFYYRAIINEAADYLEDNGLLALEMGDAQAATVTELLLQSRNFKVVKVVKDYNDIDRVIVSEKMNEAP